MSGMLGSKIQLIKRRQQRKNDTGVRMEDAMQNVYEKCPVLENEKFRLRLIRDEDAKDLLKVYSDEKAVPIFNSDNCHGDFHITTLEAMKETIYYWLLEYERAGFVRWTVVDKESDEAVGTIELFHRESQDYFNSCGLLRLDLRSDYEEKESILKILSVITEPTYELFDCTMIATKAIPAATERIAALSEMGFGLTEEKLVAPDGKEYTDYWIRRK